MNLEQKIMAEMKDAMKAKDEAALRGLRAIKAEIIKAKTEPGVQGEISADTELKMLQKMVKQRKETADVYQTQNRPELAAVELAQAAVIEAYLPKQMNAEEIKTEIAKIITAVGATSPADMGKVMGAATKQLAGKADGKLISTVVKELLNA